MPKIFTDEDRKTIKNKLLKTGQTLLESKSYTTISLDEITALNGIAKGTFYNFFPSKEMFFYEVMQKIKEDNRYELKRIFKDKPIEKLVVKEYLFHRYTITKTVYEYFTPDEIRKIIRKLPDGDNEDDSIEFAKFLFSQNHILSDCKYEVLVNLCNILALASANRNILDPSGYEKSIQMLVDTLANYIFDGSDKND